MVFSILIWSHFPHLQCLGTEVFLNKLTFELGDIYCIIRMCIHTMEAFTVCWCGAFVADFHGILLLNMTSYALFTVCGYRAIFWHTNLSFAYTYDIVRPGLRPEFARRTSAGRRKQTACWPRLIKRVSSSALLLATATDPRPPTPDTVLLCDQPRSQ